MTENVARCGINCSKCPWSKKVKESMTEEQYKNYKTVCKNVLGYAPTGAYQNCVGCQTPENEWPKGTVIPLKNCPTRLCVLKSNIDNCAFCSRFPCDYIKSKANEWSKENVEKRMNKTISEDEYQKYVSPFEAYKRLESIHSKLTSEQIVPVTSVPHLKNTIVIFPDSLENTEIDVHFFKIIHELLQRIMLSNLGLNDTDTYAQQELLKSRIKHLIRFLWIIGNYAVYIAKDQNLLLDAKPFLKNKYSETALGKWSYIENYVINPLKELGIICEFIQLSTEKIGSKGWVTPTGALRYENWQMKVTFTKELGGIDTLLALQYYTRKLDEKYSKKSFRFFAKADMRVLLEQ